MYVYKIMLYYSYSIKYEPLIKRTNDSEYDTKHHFEGYVTADREIHLSDFRNIVVIKFVRVEK